MAVIIVLSCLSIHCKSIWFIYYLAIYLYIYLYKVYIGLAMIFYLFYFFLYSNVYVFFIQCIDSRTDENVIAIVANLFESYCVNSVDYKNNIHTHQLWTVDLLRTVPSNGCLRRASWSYVSSSIFISFISFSFFFFFQLLSFFFFLNS